MKCKCAFFLGVGGGWGEELQRIKANIKLPLMCHAGAVMEMKEKNILEKSVNQYLVVSIFSFYSVLFPSVFRTGDVFVANGKELSMAVNNIIAEYLNRVQEK